MPENISVDIGVNAQELERALKRIDQMFNRGWGKGSEGSGDKQISDLRRIITSLVNQQNIYLRAAERSGRVHAARMAEQERYFEGVEQNIRLRAKLREAGGTGGGSPATDMLSGKGGGLGELAKAIEKAINKRLKEITKYQMAQEDIEGAMSSGGGIKSSGGRRSGGAAIGNPMSGVPASKGIAPAIDKMGKWSSRINDKLGGFIKQGSKFMGSSAGQGMMAGGAGMASMLTMIIKKAMEASPMLQQMLKIMNVAMTLFLRPIGDFIGGMLKPIMLFFLREVAVPMLRKGKDMIRIGEAFGKGALGFLLKPIETIREAMNPFSSSFDGVKEWMTEQKLKALATEMNDREVLTVLNIIANKDKGPVTVGQDPLTGAAGYTTHGAADYQNLKDKFPDLLAKFEEIMGQGKAHGGNMSYTYATNYSSTGGGGGNVASGMGALSDEFLVMGTAADTFSAAVTKFELAINPKTEEPLPVADDMGGGAASTDLYLESIQIIKDMQDTVANIPWDDIGFHDTPAKMLQAFQTQVGSPMLSGKKGETEYEAHYLKYLEITKNDTQSVLQGIKDIFTANLNPGHPAHAQVYGTGVYPDEYGAGQPTFGSDNDDASENFESGVEYSELVDDTFEQIAETMGKTGTTTTKMWSINQGVWQSAAAASEEIAVDTKETVDLFGAMAEMTLAGYKAVQALIEQFVAMKRAFNSSKADSPRQHGGMINEPIFGVGKSGTTYSFGEAGPEMVTPMFGGKPKGGMGSIGPVNINVSIESVKDDVDLEKLKPIVERALQEVHARRGII